MRTIREVMDMDVCNLELSVRCLNCMRNMNIKKLCEVTALSKDDFLKIRNFGHKSINELDGKLKEIGLWWQRNDRDWLNWGMHHIEWIKTH